MSEVPPVDEEAEQHIGMLNLTPNHNHHHITSKNSSPVLQFLSNHHKMIIGCLLFLLFAVTLCMVGFVLWSSEYWPFSDKDPKDKPTNVIFMIGDGFGPASQTFARIATLSSPGSKDGDHSLILDSLLVGTVRTYSSNSHVTDSAAGATAYSCALKTYNGAIGVDPNGKPCATLMEAAISRGMRTGIVVTTNITDATPAAFSAHALQRSHENKIAYQQIVDMAKLNKKDKWGVDVMFGGGRCFFLPKTNGDTESCRDDARDVYGMAQRDYGYHIAEARDQMDKLNKLPVLGLFSNVEMKFNIDRMEADPEPTLAEMTSKALQLLKENTKDDRGFFLMVEGSRIDHAGHSNDIAAQLREVQAYNDAVRVALEFAKKDGNTLIISTADHETGGVTLGRCVDRSCPYLYNDKFVSGIKGSTEKIASEIQKAGNENAVSVMKRFGISDLTEQEQFLIFNTNRTKDTSYNVMLGVDEVINRRAHIGFSTLGHTGIDINLYAYGDAEKLFKGNQENIDVGAKVADLLGFDLEELTKTLKPSE